MESSLVRQVRSFNRAVTQQVGALNDQFLGRGRPLGECRLLYEIGHEGAEIRRLRSRLDLDSGYLSRLLRSLERQGLVAAAPDTADGRVRRVRLTREGRRELAELDRRSDAFAEGMLAPLNPAQRERLTTAMAVVERLMRAAAIRIEAEPAGSVAAQICLEHYFHELAERFRAGFDPAQSISAEPGELMPPRGIFLVARSGGEPVGCGALKVNVLGFGEIKRMWVAPKARGLGVGRRILETLEAYGRRFGVSKLRLETNRALTEAQSLYRAHGYCEVERFNDEPYAHHWFEKSL